MSAAVRPGDRGTVVAAVEVLSGSTRRKGVGRLWAFLGPAFVAAVAGGGVFILDARVARADRAGMVLVAGGHVAPGVVNYRGG